MTREVPGEALVEAEPEGGVVLRDLPEVVPSNAKQASPLQDDGPLLLLHPHERLGIDEPGRA